VACLASPDDVHEPRRSSQDRRPMSLGRAHHWRGVALALAAGLKELVRLSGREGVRA
jgi:hypothetical protein